MKVKWRTAVKAVVYFLLLGFVLPMLLGRNVDAVWLIICAGIAFVITVLPDYLIGKFKKKRVDTHVTTARRKWVNIAICILSRKWVRISFCALGLFILMTFVVPALEGKRADTAWVIISAITAPIATVIADYLTEKQKERKRRNTQESQRTQSRKN
jgi:phosphotransferase system  glucose/maltose/N-acetylglucosamine-specific IIC component